MRLLFAVVLAIVMLPGPDAGACQSTGHGCDPPPLAEVARAATRVVAGTVESIDKDDRCVIAVTARWKGEATKRISKAECWRWKAGASVIALELPADSTWKVAPQDVVADTRESRATLAALFGKPAAP